MSIQRDSCGLSHKKGQRMSRKVGRTVVIETTQCLLSLFMTTHHVTNFAIPATF